MAKLGSTRFSVVPSLKRTPWRSLESEVTRRLRHQLTVHLRAARSAHATVRAVVTMVAATPASDGVRARTVQSRLLVRLSNDLRTVELLCVRGYILQAMTVAASIHELAHVVAFIGEDDARALRWEKHDEMQHTYPSLRQRAKTVRGSLVALGFEGDELENEFRNQEDSYSLFCAAKHGN